VKVTPSTAPWITFPEIQRYVKVVIWIAQNPLYKEDLTLLAGRISTLVKNNGFNWTFIYLKESLRITVRYLAGTPDKLCTTKVRVRIDRLGLPVIIPFPLRQLLNLEKENGNIVRSVLTLLSIFRVFKTTVKPDFSSITGEFTGLSASLKIRTVTKKLFKGWIINLNNIQGFISESAGPNASKATAGAAFDAIALMHVPIQYREVIKVLYNASAWLYLASLVSCSILGFPVYLLQKTGIQPKFHMGRLGVVYDQAGKARIIAMTNWWVQLCLKPLHKRLFSFLETLDTDGTFNQFKPVERLLSRNNTDAFSCFDLSSATDRLPIDLQVDILNEVLNGLGHSWKTLLNIKWFYKGEYYNYAVGQPMGAYSSWAMLAVTHHVIVHKAAERCGLNNFSDYAVLGDDIIIQNDKVAQEYLMIMKSLGVGINMNKTVVSTDLLEFAKRLTTRTHDISPVGPGAILSTIRRPLMAGILFSDLNLRGMISISDTFKDYLSSFPFKVKRMGIVLGIFGIRGQFLSLSQLDVETLSWISNVELIDHHSFVESLRNQSITESLKEAESAVKTAKQEEKFFYKNFFRLSVGKTVTQDYFGILTLFVSPMFWLYLEQFITATVKAEYWLRDVQLAITYGNSDGFLDVLFRSDLSNLSIKWNRTIQRKFTSKVRALTAHTLVDMINHYYSSRGLAHKANFSKIHKGL
jgi:hypothetical protein